MTQGLLFVISGPSGAGKSTILKEVLEKDKKLRFSISATTRKKRKGEVEGVHYFFISKDEFKKTIAEGKFLEWAKVHQSFYGTPISFVKETLKRGLDCILDIDVQGALQVIKKYPDAILIFIASRSISILKKRLLNRDTENVLKIKERLNIARWELKNVDKYDYFIVNDKLSTAISKIKAIILTERAKTKRQTELIKRLKSRF